jgi:O-antigen ligase/tetratricopeptide (TPR) repeat protein
LFFPFITGKNFFFRIGVELLFFLWVITAVLDKKYRPRLTPLFWAVSALLLIASLSSILGENFYKSLWSNFERMEGLLTHIHLFMYFIVLSSVFRTKNDWKWYFSVMLLVSSILCLYGLLQYTGKLAIHQGNIRLDATLGNATYFAILTVFHMFITGLFMYWFRNVWARVFLSGLFVLEGVVLFLTATRGAILGFLGGLFLMGLLVSVFGKGKKTRLGFAGLVLLVLAVVGVFFSVKNTDYVKNNVVLGRFANISLTEQTTESRLTIWNMSFKAFKEHPFLGWGLENYNLVFNEYYEPKMYKQEPWFDHAHNIVFDWLVTTGAVGFSIYISVFVSALYLLWSGYRKGYFSLFESAGFTSMFAAYSFHNLFVFDNLTSYFMFFSMLGYVQAAYSAGARSMASPENVPATDVGGKKHKNKQNREKPAVREDFSFWGYFFITFSFVALIFGLYFVNIKPIKACSRLLSTLMMARQNVPASQMLKSFDDTLNLRTFGNGEAREHVSSYALQLFSSNTATQSDKQKVMDKAIYELEKQVAETSERDTRYLILLSTLYSRAGRIDDALKTVEKAIVSSPMKQQVHFVKEEIYLTIGNYEEATNAVKVAYESDTRYTEAAENYALALILSGKGDEAERVLMTTFGRPLIASDKLINAFVRMENYSKAAEVWSLKVEENPDNLQFRISLAAVYLKIKNNAAAVDALEQAKKVALKNNDTKSFEQLQMYIDKINSGEIQ